jgi:hypothetical protein
MIEAGAPLVKRKQTIETFWPGRTLILEDRLQLKFAEAKTRTTHVRAR